MDISCEVKMYNLRRRILLGIGISPNMFIIGPSTWEHVNYRMLFRDGSLKMYWSVDNQ